MTYIVLFFSVAFAVFVRVFFVDIYKMPSNSMAPTILKGEHIVAAQSAFGFHSVFNGKTYFKSNPEPGELVVYQKNRKTFIKRVVAGPGQSFEIKNGVLSLDSNNCNSEKVNVSPSSQDYVYMSEKCGNQVEHLILLSNDSTKNVPDSATQSLSDGQYLVFSDNRTVTTDNPTWEIVRIDEIVGKPYWIWLSYSSTQDFISESKGFRWNRFLTKLK